MMKLLNKKQKNNGGFSLVELIVVIAIMVVLVAVLAPIFTKYIESSRRSTDVQNANSISEAVLSDVADQKIAPASGQTTVSSVVDAGNPSAIKEQIKTKGDAVGTGKTFTYVYNANTNKCAVYVTGTESNTAADLTNENNAKAYKDAKTGEFPAATPAQGEGD